MKSHVPCSIHTFHFPRSADLMSSPATAIAALLGLLPGQAPSTGLDELSVLAGTPVDDGL